MLGNIKLAHNTAVNERIVKSFGIARGKRGGSSVGTA